MNSIHNIHRTQLSKIISVITPKRTLREELLSMLDNARGMAKQRAFGGEHCERIADSGELLMLEYKEQLRIIENITEEAREAFIEVKNTPEV